MSEFDFCISCFHQINKNDVCPYCGRKQYGFSTLPFQLKPNTLLNDRYLIGEVLGFGGFGITYKAYDITLNQILAIKEFYPAGLVNRSSDNPKVNILREDEYAKGKSIFIEEAKKSAKFFGSKNIVNVFDYFEANNTAYLKMEFLDGISLKDFINQGNGVVDVPTAINITNNILNGVSELHKNGYIHCDLSPDNIMITTDNRIVIIDLGAAKQNNRGSDINDDKVLKIGYAPPEQYQDDGSLGTFTDIYAVGAILYRMLTGKTPDESNDRAEKDTLVEPNKINNKIPKNINNVCMRALALNSSLRIQSAEQFKLGLQGKIFRTEKQEKKFRKITTFSTVAAVLAIMAISIAFGFIYRGANNTVKLDKYIKEPSTVSIWVPYDNAYYEQTKSIYNEIFTSFQNELKENETFSSEINVEVEYVEKSTYSKRLKAAIESGSSPDIFASKYCDNEAAEAEISWIVNKVIKSNYILYKSYNKECFELPISCDSRVIYVNRKYDTDGALLSASSNEEFKETEASICSTYSLETANYDYCLPSNLQRFCDGKTSLYCGKISDLPKIKNHISWLSMCSPAVEDYYIEYHDKWSVKADNEPNYASMYVLSYLLSDSAQELMFIENDSFIPLNRNILDVYIYETHKNDNLICLNDLK